MFFINSGFNDILPKLLCVNSAGLHKLRRQLKAYDKLISSNNMNFMN